LPTVSFNSLKIPSLDTLWVVFPSVGLSSKTVLELFISNCISFNTFVNVVVVVPELVSVVTNTALEDVTGKTLFSSAFN
jgi:hypothetical protein